MMPTQPPDDEARTSLAYFVNSAWARTSRSGGRTNNVLDPHGRGANVELHVEACARDGCAIARITFRATRAVAAGEELLWEYPVHKGAAAVSAPKRKRTEEYEASLAALLERVLEDADRRAEVQGVAGRERVCPVRVHDRERGGMAKCGIHCASSDGTQAQIPENPGRLVAHHGRGGLRSA